MIESVGYSLQVFGIVLWLAILWYPVYRMILRRLEDPRSRFGRIRRMSLIDWLNATGCGMFAGSILLPLGRTVIENAR